MGLEIATVVAIGSLVVGTASYINQQQQAEEAKSAASRAQQEQSKISSEQRAQNAAQQAAERRAQIREERVRRGRIMQSAQGTGVMGSSAEAGALGTLGTNLNVNMGANAGKAAAGDRISAYAQNAATFMGQSQQAAYDAQQNSKLFGLSTSIFSAAGGFKSAAKAFQPAPPDPANLPGYSNL